MTTNNYDPATSLAAYYPGREGQRIARLWAREKVLHDLADLGALQFFEGGGSDPTGLSGYSTTKLWLQVDPGVTDEPGVIRYYAGGTASDLASWPVLTREGYAAHLGARSGAEFDYAWSTATSGDPGTGKIRGNNATLASITSLAVSKTGRQGQSYGSRIATWGTNDIVRIYAIGDETKFVDVNITGAPSDQTTYYTVACTVRASSPITNGLLAGVYHLPTSPPSAQDAADAAAASAAAAEAARDAAFANANIYADVSTGRAAVSDGQQFMVVVGDEIVRYRRDSSLAETEMARYPTVAGVPAIYGLTSKFSGNDFRDGSTNWNVSGATSTTWDASGLTLELNKSGTGIGAQLRIYKTAGGGGLTLTSGHKYAVYADIDLEGDVSTSGISSVLWRCFVLSSTPGEATVGSRLTVGQAGSPITHRVAETFIETSTGLKGNPYIDISEVKDAANQNLATFELTVTYRALMVVDLGVEGDPTFDLTAATVAEFLYLLNAPFHPTPGDLSKAAVVAARAADAAHAAEADAATTAGVADIAELVRSPWVDKRVITLGHSLVSQAAWQGFLKEFLSLEGASYYGIPGGTVAPKPADGVVGFYSRAHMSDVLANLINQSDADANGIITTGLTSGVKDRSFATILWAGANDAITDYSNSEFQRLYLNKEQIASIATTAPTLSQGHYANTTAGLAGTTAGQYFSVNGDVSGWRILYKNQTTATMVYHYPIAGTSYTTDRIMSEDEQDEFEARNTTDGSAAFLSEPLSNGFVVTYEALWHTLIANYLAATDYLDRPDHRIFIVREPQAFWRFDGTLDWPQGHYERNEVHRRVADRWGFPLLDIWASSGINIGTRGMFLQIESSSNLFIHLNDKGGRQCARYIASEMLRHPPVDFSDTSDGTNLGIPTDEDDLGPWTPDNVV